jgi:hypothetical protein
MFLIYDLLIPHFLSPFPVTFCILHLISTTRFSRRFWLSFSRLACYFLWDLSYCYLRLLAFNFVHRGFLLYTRSEYFRDDATDTDFDICNNPLENVKYRNINPEIW